jgi:LmbE family N-acetylglucosaminyl deacetylase
MTKTEMNPYHHLVSEYTRLLKEGKSYPLGGFRSAFKPTVASGAPTALIFSPHPDDECIIGAMPLRLFREAGMNVVNVAVTQGSNRARQAERFQELQNACNFIGYGLVQTSPHGLEKVNTNARAQNKEQWAQSVKIISDILVSHRPRVIFFPHESDWNSTHSGTHFLVMDALKMLDPNFECCIVETEYWGAMSNPNLMLESSPQDVADLVTAVSFHIGEVRRNPFHLLLPAWMQDNVRRGSELVGGQGEAAPDFCFATLYRVRRWRRGRSEDMFEGGRKLTASQNPLTLFPSGE